MVYAPEERYLPLGKPASLDCHFSANPPLTNLRWEKDGFLFDPYNVPGVFYSRNGSLLFNRVSARPSPARGPAARAPLTRRLRRWTSRTRASTRARPTTRWAPRGPRRACACACSARPRCWRARSRCTWRASAARWRCPAPPRRSRRSRRPPSSGAG